MKCAALAPLLALAACTVDHVVAQLTEATAATIPGTTADVATASDGSTSDGSASGSSGETTGGGCKFDDAAPCEGVSDPFKAIGLGCPTTPIAGEFVDADEPSSYRVAAQFGNAYWVAREGAQLLALTTGSLPIPDANGHLFLVAGSAQPGVDNAGQNGDDLPPPIYPFPGSASGTPFQDCDGENDCSYSLPFIWVNGTAADMITLGFSVTAPADAAGFALDVAWLSAEFPERAEVSDGDLAIVWVISEGFTGNLATVEGAALTAESVRSYVVEGQLVGDHPSLAATGFDGVEGAACDYGWAVYPSCPRGGALDWTALRGPAGPGETIAVTIALMDRQDPFADTTLLLDAWRWTCEPCVPGSTCGLLPG